MGTGIVQWGDLEVPWRRIDRLWVMRDCDVVRLLGMDTRNLNRTACQRPELFPSDFAFRLRAEEFHRYYRLDRAGLRRGSRPPMVYSTAGILQAWLERNDAARVEVVRWCAELLALPTLAPPPWSHALAPPRQLS